MTSSLADRITVNPKQCGGRPCIRGMRIRVIDVLDLQAAGLSTQEILEDFPYLEREDIMAVARFASRRLDHPVPRRMKLWIDAQLSPAIARWITANYEEVEASAAYDLGYLDSEDTVIYFAAREAGAAVMTKDSDFIDLQNVHGAPPKVIWVTCGNTSNKRLKEILTAKLREAFELLEGGEDLVEITGL